MESTIRWSLKVSRETDIALRMHLAQTGSRKGALSKFVEQAVQKEVFMRTVAGVQKRNAKVPPAEMEAAIDEALTAVRAQTWGKAKAARRARHS